MTANPKAFHLSTIVTVDYRLISQVSKITTNTELISLVIYRYSNMFIRWDHSTSIKEVKNQLSVTSHISNKL